MPKESPSYTRVQLLLPNDLAGFVDHLVAQLSPPGVKFTRQDAIRNTLVKLKTTMFPEPSSTTPSPKRRATAKR